MSQPRIMIRKSIPAACDVVRLYPERLREAALTARFRVTRARSGVGVEKTVRRLWLAGISWTRMPGKAPLVALSHGVTSYGRIPYEVLDAAQILLQSLTQPDEGGWLYS